MSGGLGRDIASEAFSRHLDRNPDDRSAFQRDAPYHAQMTFIKNVIVLADQVMEDEGVPQDVRERVARCVLYGAPHGDPLEYERQREMIRKLAAKPPADTSWLTMADGG